MNVVGRGSEEEERCHNQGLISHLNFIAELRRGSTRAVHVHTSIMVSVEVPRALRTGRDGMTGVISWYQYVELKSFEFQEYLYFKGENGKNSPQIAFREN